MENGSARGLAFLYLSQPFGLPGRATMPEWNTPDT